MPPDTFEQVVRRLAAIIGHGRQGAALARALAREGARTRADLKKPRVLSRLPQESRASVLYSPARNVPLAEARAVADEVRRRLTFAAGPGGRRRLEVIPVGSVRREAARVKDLDFLVVVPPALEEGSESVLASAALRPPRRGDRISIAETYAGGSRRRSVILRRDPGPGRARPTHYRADLFMTTTAEKPFALFHYSGPATYNIRTRALAKRHGWLLNQYGLFSIATGRRVPGSANIRTERDLAEFLGVTFRHPRDRGVRPARRR